jgi:predicted MPP superfamily phosphohydrolase
MKQQMIVFFLIAFLILALGYGYVGWRLIPPLQLPTPWNWLAWTALIILLALPPVALALAMRRVENGFVEAMSSLAYVSLGFFSVLITMVLLRDVLWMASAGVQKLMALIGSSNAADVLSPDPERRRFLIRSMSVGIASVATALTAYGYYEARRRPAIVEIVVPLPQLPADFDGFRIVQITDIHAGLTVKRDFIETVVAQVKDLNADLVAFTGDLADGSVPHLREHVAPLAELSAPFGKYFITGNHEYYSGVEPWVEEATRLGFTVLLNEHRVVQKGSGRILLAGVTDFSGGQFMPSHASSPEAAIANAPTNVVKILLAHQPKSIREAARVGFDLQISGHTHGGQFFPWNLAAALDQPFVAGLHKFQKMWIYVSKGTGYWGPPLRLGARSEITVITLRREFSQA